MPVRNFPSVVPFGSVPSIDVLEAQAGALARVLLKAAGDPVLNGRGISWIEMLQDHVVRSERQQFSVHVVTQTRLENAPFPASFVVKEIADIAGLVASPSNLWSVSLTTDLLVLDCIGLSGEAPLPIAIRSIVDACRDTVETFAIAVDSTIVDTAVSLWADRLDVSPARVLVLDGKSIERSLMLLSERTDLLLLKLGSVTRQLQWAKDEIAQLIEIERDELTAIATEVSAFDDSTRRALTKMETGRQRFAEYIESNFTEYGQGIVETLWETPSLEAALLREAKPDLDPRPIVDHIQTLDDFDMSRIAPSGVRQDARVFWRDSTYECRLSFGTIGAMRESLRRQFASKLSTTHRQMGEIRERFTEWAQTLPDRWAGPWEDLRRIQLPACHTPDLDRLVENFEFALDDEQRLVHKGFLQRFRQSRSMAGMSLSFVTLALPLIAFLIMGDTSTSAVRTVPWLAATAIVLSIAFFFQSSHTEQLDRRSREDDLVKRIRKNAMSQFCRLIHQFEQARIAATENYLDMLREWLMKSVDRSMDQAKATTQRMVDSVPRARAQVEARRRNLEGLGAETLSRRLSDAEKSLDTLKSSLTKLRSNERR